MEFAHEAFMCGKRHLLQNIQRRKTVPLSSEFWQQRQPTHSDPASMSMPTESDYKVRECGADGDIEHLISNKDALYSEVQRLREQKLHIEFEAEAMVRRVQEAENRLEQMMDFLAKALHNQAFAENLMWQSEMLLFDDELRKRHFPSYTEKTDAHLEKTGFQEMEKSLKLSEECFSIQEETQESFHTIEHKQGVVHETGLAEISHFMDGVQPSAALSFGRDTCTSCFLPLGSIHQLTEVSENAKDLLDYENINERAALSVPQLDSGFNELDCLIDLLDYRGELRPGETIDHPMNYLNQEQQENGTLELFESGTAREWDTRQESCHS